MVNSDFFDFVLSLDNRFLTLREIDAISCFTSGKSSKSLSYFLGISQKTFDTHWNNIKNKYNFSSKENLLNYLEDTNSYWAYYNYYLLLKMEKVFRKYCKNYNCEKNLIFTCFTKNRKNQIYLELLKRHFEYVGCNVSMRFSEYNGENKPLINIKDDKEKSITIFESKPPESSFNLPKNSLYLHQEDNHFKFICKILVFFGLEDIFKENEKLDLEIGNIQKLVKNSNVLLPTTTHSPQKKNKDKLYNFFIVFVLLFTTFFSFYIVSSTNNVTKKQISLTFNEHLIEREQYLNRIKSILDTPTGINTCIIVGMVGSGKTTLAKQYIYKAKHSVSFEINAHSAESIERSLFEIAHQLVENIQQKETLDVIKYNHSNLSKREKILEFISSILKKHTGWILLFDNVNSIEEIENYLPKDQRKWGDGAIIITSCNHNIASNFDHARVLKLEELNKDETHQLIVKACGIDNEKNGKEIQDLAKNIPSLPLDINLVCSYFKRNKTKISTLLSENDQKKYLEERGYILEKSFNESVNKEHQNIFMFLSLCDFKDIPKEFLYRFFSKEITDELISNLKKYSLIVDEKKKFISIHSFVQKQMLSYAFENFGYETVIAFLDYFIEKVVSITKEEIPSAIYEQIIVHFYALLHNLRNLNILNYEEKLHYILGHCHYKGTRSLTEAKNHFEQVLASNHSFIDSHEKKELFYFLAVLCNDLGYDKMALSYVDEGLKLSEQNIEKAKFLCQKGCILTQANKVKNALSCFDDALEVIKDEPCNSEKTNRMSTIYQEKAWLFAISQLTKDDGQYSLSLMQTASSYLPKELKKGIHRSVCYYYTTLGSIYCKLGEYDKALKEGFSKATDIIEQRLDGKTHHISKLFIDEGMGECYLRIGKINKASIILSNMLSKAYTIRGKSYVSLFIPKVLLMECYLRSDDLESAENELVEILKYDVSAAPNTYLFMNCLLYYNAAFLFYKKNDFERSKLYFNKFFTHMSDFLKKTYGFKTQEQKELCKQQKETISSKNDYLLLEKQACDLLKTVYPKINFSFHQHFSSKYF